MSGRWFQSKVLAAEARDIEFRPPAPTEKPGMVAGGWVGGWRQESPWAYAHLNLCRHHTHTSLDTHHMHIHTTFTQRHTQTNY